MADIFDVESSNAQCWPTLRRFSLLPPTGKLLVVLALAFSTWTYVLTPDLIGQVVDCYLTPNTGADASALMGGGEAADVNCWYTDDAGSLSRSQTVSGIREIILILVGLFLAGAVATGLQFYTMRYAGLHVLNRLRIEVFQHIHRLSLSYYARHEAGDIMSRITNDTDTVQQAVNFALVQVARGGIHIIWLFYAMFSRSVPLALLAMTTVPFMVLATILFSHKHSPRPPRYGGKRRFAEHIAGVPKPGFTARTRHRALPPPTRQPRRENRSVAFTSALPRARKRSATLHVIVAGVAAPDGANQTSSAA